MSYRVGTDLNCSVFSFINNFVNNLNIIFLQIYVINAHYLVKTAYAIIKPVLSEQSREKVIFLDSSYHEQLAEGVGRENLFRRWGGIRQPLSGDPEWGTLRIGGLPPKGMR